MIIDIIKLYFAIGLAWGFVAAIEVVRFIAYGIVPFHVSAEGKARILESRAGLKKAIQVDGFPRWLAAIIVLWAVVIHAVKDAILWPARVIKFVKGRK